jgi:hypothetical protein
MNAAVDGAIHVHLLSREQHEAQNGNLWLIMMIREKDTWRRREFGLCGKARGALECESNQKEKRKDNTNR